MISDYLDALTRELDFDRSLSRCVRREVEDHLWEAVAADPAGDTSETQRRAVANFGDARSIAAEFAVISLARQSRRAAIAAVLVIAGVFIVMSARVAWTAATPWTISDEMRAVRDLVGLIDRYAFWSAVVIGLGGWAYIRSRKLPLAFDPAYRRQLGRFFLLCRAAAAALIISVMSDAVLTTFRLWANEFSTLSMLSIVSIAIEIICVGFLIWQIRSVALRAAFTAALTQA
jgi:HAAS domain-containing protein